MTECNTGDKGMKPQNKKPSPLPTEWSKGYKAAKNHFIYMIERLPINSIYRYEAKPITFNYDLETVE